MSIKSGVLIFMCHCIFGPLYAQKQTAPKPDTLRIIALNDSAKTFWRTNPDSTKLLALQALKASAESAYTSGIAHSYNNLGAANFFMSNYDSAYHYWSLSLEQWQLTNNVKQEAKLYGNLALALKEQNKSFEAILYSQKAIDLRSKLNDSLQLGIGYNNLGIMYERLGDTKKALFFHYKALNIRQAIGDSSRISSTYVNLGSVYNLSRNLDSAYFFIVKALKLDTISKDTWGSAIAYSKLGEYYYLKKSLDSSIYFYNQALALASQVKAKHLVLELKLWKAKVKVSQNKLNEALTIINEAKTIQVEPNTKTEISKLELLSDIYYRKKDFRKAAYYLGLFIQENDSIQKIRSENKIAEISSKHFYDIRELEIKNIQAIEEQELNSRIETEQVNQSKLAIVLIFVILTLIAILFFFVQLAKKNKQLIEQQKEIEVLTAQQQETINTRSTELSSAKDAVSRFAFLNAHELRAPLARILGVIHLSDKNDIDEKRFISAIKISIKELEMAIHKIRQELKTKK